MSAVHGPWLLDVDALAPVRAGHATPARTPLADIPKPSSAQLTVAIEHVTRTGWVDMITPHLPQELRSSRGRNKGGRKRILTVEAVLTAMLLLPIMERPFIIKDMWRLLDKGLDANTRRRLGLGKARISERMVSKLYGQICSVLNSSCYAESNEWLFDAHKVHASLGLAEHITLDEQDLAIHADWHLGLQRERLETFLRAGLRATHPDEYTHAGDYALDATFLESWENPKSTRRRTTWVSADGEKVRKPLKPHLMADPDARWWSKKANARGKLHGAGAESGLGYAVTAITWLQEDLGPNMDAPDLPRLIDHVSVRGPRGPMWQEGSRALEAMVAHHEAEDEATGREDRQRGDLLADREYSRVAEWHKHAHRMGFTPHFHLAAEQRENIRVLANGAVIIGGIPYSPGMPAHLRREPAQPLFATRKQRAANAAFYDLRKPYRLKATGKARRDDGSLELSCGASVLNKHQLNCANKPASVKGRAGRIEIGTALPVISNPAKPAICSASKLVVSFDETPFWQPHIPGTAEHQWSVHRRSNVESAFAGIKNETGQSLRRGTFRVMGICKVTIAVVLQAMAANIAEVARWRERQAGVTNLADKRSQKQPVKRVPRRVTRKRAEDQARRERQRAAKAQTAELDTGPGPGGGYATT